MWLETLTWVFQFVFGLCALLLGIISYARNKTKKRRRWPTLSYFRARVCVQEWLDTRNSSGTRRIEELSLKLSEMVCKDLANATEDKERIETDIEEEFKEFHSDQSNPKEVRDALLFEVISHLVKSPSDPLGQRRAAIVKEIITNSFEKEVKEKKANTNHEKCSNLKPYVLAKLTSIWDYLCIISRTSSFVKLSMVIPMLSTLVFYTADYSSDFQVASIYGCQYISLTDQGNSFCKLFMDPPSMNYTMREIGHFKDELYGNFLFPAIVMYLIILFSFLHVVPSIVSVKHLYQFQQFMLNIDNEKQNIRFPPEKFLTRYNLSQMESSLEGSLQLIVQSSTYLSKAWFITWAEQILLESPVHGNPLQFKILWISIFLSLVSLSMAQFRRRAITQEYFSSGWIETVLFFVACFCNTVFASLLFVSLATSALDILFIFDYPDTVIYIVVNTIVYLVILITILLLTPLLRLPTSAIYHQIMSTASPAYSEAISKQCWAVAAISIVSACLNGVVSWEYGREDGMDEYFTWLVNYHEKNQNITEWFEDSPFDPLFPSEAYSMNNRVTFYMTYMLVMPLSWVVSSVLLHWYLEKDNMKMEFRQKQKEKKWPVHMIRLLISGNTQDFKPNMPEEGFWVDLNTESEDGMDLENFLDQFDAKEVSADVTVCQEETIFVEGEVTTGVGGDADDIPLKKAADMTVGQEEIDDKEGEMETGTGADADDIIKTDENIPLTPTVPDVDTGQHRRLKEIQRSFACWRPDAETAST